VLNGAHSPNKAIDPADLDVLEAGRFQAVKLLTIAGCQHGEAEVHQVRSVLPYADLCVRLPDTRKADGTFPSPYQWADACAEIIMQFAPHGVHTFQADNEPQYQWNQRGYGPWEYQWFMRIAMRHLRYNLQGYTYTLISPPLSWSPALWSLGEHNPTPYTLNDWLAAFMWRGATGTEPSLWALFDEVGANVYWESRRQMGDPSFGRHVETLRTLSGMPLTVLEYGLDPRRNFPTPAQAEAAMVEQYPVYLAYLRALRYVSAAYAFIVGGTEDWARFQWTMRVAKHAAPPVGRARLNGPIPA
jgi:hypothetical protein